MAEAIKSATSKADFIRMTGIGSELADFLAEFTENPENLFSMSFERRRKIEKQIDAVLSSFE